MDDRTGYEAQARQWTHLYAGGPKPSGAAAASTSAPSRSAPPPVQDEAIARGLDPRHVDNFQAMGFARSTVVEVLARLNYRGRNVANVTEDQVLDLLISS